MKLSETQLKDTTHFQCGSYACERLRAAAQAKAFQCGWDACESQQQEELNLLYY